MRFNSSSISSFSFSRAPSTASLSITHPVMSSGHTTSVVALGTVVEGGSLDNAARMVRTVTNETMKALAILQDAV